MAREFDGPLTKADIKWLQERYATSYVDRMIDLHGRKGGKQDSADAAKESEEAARKAQEAADAADEAAREGSEPEAPDASESGEEETEEDLIGDDETFDVLGSTEGEVKTWVETASDEDKAAALATEQARGDRDPRKGVVALLS